MFSSLKKIFLIFADFLENKFKTSKVLKKRKKRKLRKILKHLDLEEKFTKIHSINYWNSNESISGVGSTLQATENLRLQLPLLFEKLSIKSVFDGPCGDFNWMKFVINQCNIDYCGGDIVKPLVENNNLKYKNKHIYFIHINLTQKVPPFADLMICRDCLFHLSYDDTKKLLSNFVASQTPYLLTTTYLNQNNFENQDITSGNFRKIDLFSEPYFFSKEVLYTIDDWNPGESPRFLALWSRDQVIKTLALFK